jgi:hypothetical protein
MNRLAAENLIGQGISVKLLKNYVKILPKLVLKTLSGFIRLLLSSGKLCLVTQ